MRVEVEAPRVLSTKGQLEIWGSLLKQTLEPGVKLELLSIIYTEQVIAPGDNWRSGSKLHIDTVKDQPHRVKKKKNKKKLQNFSRTDQELP